jgi:hypothetical protein
MRRLVDDSNIRGNSAGLFNIELGVRDAGRAEPKHPCESAVETSAHFSRTLVDEPMTAIGGENAPGPEQWLPCLVAS